jgi:hypothetical protein
MWGNEAPNSRAGWMKRAHAAEAANSWIEMTEVTTNTTQLCDKEKFMSDAENIVRDLVELTSSLVVCHTAMQHPGLHNVVTALCKNKYDPAKYAKKTGLDVKSHVNAHRFKKLLGQSYAEGMILRLKSEHHIPVEQLLTGIILYRAGISYKGWSHLSQRAVLPSKLVIKSFINRFIERPFLLPFRGRIMLGIYDNLAYKRKFLYQRVGDFGKSTINTCNLMEIPIGDFIDFGPEQAVWRTPCLNLVDLFDPDSEETAGIQDDIVAAMYNILQNQKVWEYPVLEDDIGRK